MNDAHFIQREKGFLEFSIIWRNSTTCSIIPSLITAVLRMEHLGYIFILLTISKLQGSPGWCFPWSFKSNYYNRQGHRTISFFLSQSNDNRISEPSEMTCFFYYLALLPNLCYIIIKIIGPEPRKLFLNWLID